MESSKDAVTPISTRELSIAAAGDRTSLYTQAMVRCLRGREEDSTDAPSAAALQVLVNMVQGRMLEYLADSICLNFHITDTLSRTRILNALTSILSDEFFAVFRRKVRERPDLVLSIARRIIRKETRGCANDYQKATDRLFPALFRKYFECRDLNTLLELMESDETIERTLVLHLLQQRVTDHAQRQRLLDVLEQERDGICTALFMDYLKDDNLAGLLHSVESGHWKQEADQIQEKLAILQGA